MKKILLFIVWLLFVWNIFAYDVIIYDNNNNVLMMYEVEEETTEITLDGDWSKDWNNFTFNGGFDWTTVHYIDWYWKEQTITIDSDLYLNWEYSLSYTGEQYLQLSENQCWTYSWYVPVFNITGWIEEVSTSWNVFNNFAENSVKMFMSNIPNYIQYVFIFMILLFILWFLRKIRK